MTVQEHHGRMIRSDLQGLRGLALLFVVISHAGVGWFRGGYIGVDVFFVLSGFLISRILWDELEGTGTISFRKFFARRLKRLLPALSVMVLATFVLGGLVFSGLEAEERLGSAPYAITWTSNIYFNVASIDYFNELAAEDLYLHTWSLSVEEQFYLFWPLLLFFTYRYAVKRSGLQASKALKICLLLTCAISFSISVFLILNHPFAAFFQTISRIWQFSIGALVGTLPVMYLKESNGEKSRSYKCALGVLSVALIGLFGCGLFFTESTVYPGFWALLPTLCTALIIYIGQSSVPNPLNWKLLTFLGDRSYSIYLWHWPVLMLGFYFGWKANYSVLLALFVVILILAEFSYRAVELPFWKGRYSQVDSNKVLAVSVLGSLIICLFMVNITQFRAGSTDTANGFDESQLRQIEQRIRHDVPEIYHNECDSWYHSAEVKPCFFGNQEAEQTVVLFGDSVGVQWYAFIPALYPKQDWNIIVYTKSACNMAGQEYYYPRIKRQYSECTRWRDGVLQEIANISPDLVYIGGASTYGFSKQEWIEGSSKLISSLSKVSGKVVVIPGTPVLHFDGPSCVLRNMNADGSIEIENCYSESDYEEAEIVAGYLTQSASRYDNAYLLNLNDIVCPKKRCNAISDVSGVVFRDSRHLTNTFVKNSAGNIERKLRDLGILPN